MVGVEPCNLVGRSSSCATRRRSIGASVSVSKPIIGRSPPATFGRLRHQHQVLDADAVGAFLVVAGLVGAGSCRGCSGAVPAWRCAAVPRARTGSCRRHGRCRGRSRGRAPTARWRANGSSSEPRVPSGNARVAMAIWPFSTSVKRSRISGVGLPIATVRVMSVVPSRYWPPKSTGTARPAQLAVGGARHAVVHDGAIRAGAGDGVEADTSSAPASRGGSLPAPHGARSRRARRSAAARSSQARKRDDRRAVARRAPRARP